MDAEDDGKFVLDMGTVLFSDHHGRQVEFREWFGTINRQLKTDLEFRLQGKGCGDANPRTCSAEIFQNNLLPGGGCSLPDLGGSSYGNSRVKA